MIGRKGYILILLILSWPVDNLHRLLNDRPVTMGNWYFFNRSYTEELQWYVHDCLHAFSYLLIFIAILLYIEMPKRRDQDINRIFTAMVINQAIDLIHYIGWHRQSEVILTVEGLILTYASLKIIINKWTGPLNSPKC